MIRKHKKTCILCGKEYSYCSNCSEYANLPVWHNIYHDENCKNIFNIATNFHAGKINKIWVVTADNQLFDEVYTGPLMIGEKLLLSHEPVDIPFALNIHGHNHSGWEHKDWAHLNVCADVIGYTPINLNQVLKGGAMAHVQSIHRQTINDATKRAKKREKKGKKK